MRCAISKYLNDWLRIGQENPWINEANDPPFSLRSFCECHDIDDLLAKFSHGDWCLGQAFYLGDLCFIQQVDGGDEWLAIKEDVAFESISFRAILKKWSYHEAKLLIFKMQQATKEQCKTLDY